MEMRLRYTTEEDYTILINWWKWFRFPVPPQDCLPENGKSGVMVSVNGIDVCAGFLYATNSKLAWIEFIVSNPEYREKNRKEVIEQCLYGLCEIAKTNGFTAVYSTVQNENLIKSYEKLGFTQSKSTELILKL